MKLGFVSAILPDLSLDEVLEFAAREKFACVEVMCWPVGKADRKYAGVTHIDVGDFTVGRRDDVMETIARRGVPLSGLGYYPNPLDPDTKAAQKAVDHLLEVIQAASMLSLHQVNTFVGRDWTKSVDENWPRFLKTWKPIVKYAEDHGVRIGIENCPMYFTKDEWPSGKNLAISPAIWRRMFSDIPSEQFGLNYDPSHLVWQQMDPIKPLREFSKKLFHVHAKDVRVDREKLDDVGILATPLEYHRPKLPGLGEVNWGRFCSVLADVGYDGPVCIEVEDKSYERNVETRMTALRQSGRYLRNFMP